MRPVAPGAEAKAGPRRETAAAKARSATERAEAWVARVGRGVRGVLERRAEVAVVDVDLHRRERPIRHLEALEEHAVPALGGAGAEGVAEAEPDRERARHLIREARHLQPFGLAAESGADAHGGREVEPRGVQPGRGSGEGAHRDAGRARGPAQAGA